MLASCTRSLSTADIFHEVMCSLLHEKGLGSVSLLTGGLEYIALSNTHEWLSLRHVVSKSYQYDEIIHRKCEPLTIEVHLGINFITDTI